MRFAIAHVFATGPAGPAHTPVHVGLQPIGHEPAPLQEWVCRPARPIRRRLYDASRLDAAATEGAPSWEVVAPAVRAACAQYDVLFLFDTGPEGAWFEAILRDAPGPRCVDLRLLASFFLPERDLNDLVALCEQTVPGYQRSKPQLPFLLRAFRRLLADIVEAILAPAADLGHAHPVFAWLARAVVAGAPPAFEAVLGLAERAVALQWEDDYRLPAFPAPTPPDFWPPDPKTLLAHLRAGLPEPEAYAEPEAASLKAVRPDFLDATFYALGRREGNDLRDRPAQRQYARFCGEAFHAGGLYAAEAGTGTGKTLGYLVPACEFVRLNPGRKVLVATATKTLQDQIVREELPRLTYAGGLHQDVRGAVLKGKSNYLCAGALADLHREVFPAGSADAMLAWLYLYVRLRRAGGTIDDVPSHLMALLSALRGQLVEVSAEGACTSDQCSLGQRCVYPRHLQEALRAQVVVTNHYKLASIPPVLAERVAVLVVDEADQLPDNLRSALRDELTPSLLRRDLLERLTGRARGTRRGFLEVLEEQVLRDLERRGDEPGNPNVGALDMLHQTSGACAGVQERLREIGALIGWLEAETRWQDVEMRRRGFTEALLAQLEALEEALRQIASSLRGLARSKRYDRVKQPEAKGSIGLRRERDRLERYAEVAERWRTTVGAIRQEHPSRAWVHTVAGSGRSWSVARAPFDLGRIVEGQLMTTYASIVLTSATLYVSDRLDFFRTELGLKRSFEGTLRLPSPFDYAGHVYGAVTTFLPSYDHRAPAQERARWMDGVVETLRVLTVATEGRTLILFTSTEEMHRVHERLVPLLDPYDIEVLVQNGPSQSELQRFREQEHTVLLPSTGRRWR